MKKKFEFEFEDLSSSNTIAFDYDDEVDEEMQVVIENNKPVLYANRQAYLSLAKIFIRMSLCEYKHGFHVHLNQDFDGDKEEIMRCHLTDQSSN